MTPPSFKSIGTIALALSAGSLLNAETVTDPVGVVKITIAAAPSGGTKLTAISATLRNSIAYHGTATSVGSYNADAGSNPPNPDQPITQTGAGWTTNQWTTEPHLCYIENAAGAEEAYLIKSHTADTLTLATSFDFSTRYTSTPTFRIVKANTLGSLFGSATVPFLTGSSPANADTVYAWNGDSWHSYFHNGSSWQDDSTAFGGDVNDAVVFPDEGLFVLRRGTTSIELTLGGNVPTKAQVSTIPGEGLSFVSNRYPIGTVLSNLGFENLTNWVSGSSPSNADTVYIWNSTSNAWKSYWYDGSDWKSDANAFGGDSNNVTISPDSAMFVLSRGINGAAGAANTHPIPYTP